MTPGPARPGRGCGCLAGLGFLALAWFVTSTLALFETPRKPGSDGTPSASGEPPSPESLPETWRTDVGALREFARGETPRRWRLSFGFIDYHGRTHRVACLVDRAAHAAERERFGYDLESLNAALNRELALLVDSEAAARGVGPYFRIEVHDAGAGRWSWTVPAGTGAAERGRAAAAIGELTDWIDRELPGRSEEIRAALYRERGMLLRGTTLSVDYEQLILRGTEPLDDCFRALHASGAGSSLRQYLGLLLAFYQELGYEVPPDEVDGRRTLGLRVPTDVLVWGRGDCDSKAVAFAAMWRRFPTRAVMVLVPGHALVGVEVPARPGERTVRVGNRTYVLCEVAGPGKWRPGARSVEGSFEYVLVEPA